MRPHIDEELDNLKHVYNGIDGVLVRQTGFRSAAQTEYHPQSKVAEQLSETVPPDYATSLNVVYFPQLGTMPILRMYRAVGVTVYH